MSGYLPNSAFLREPNLLRPGGKPIGRVKVNKAHTLARGLAGCWLFQTPYPINSGLPTGGFFEDLSGYSNHGVWAGATTGTGEIGVVGTEKGLCLRQETDNSDRRVSIASVPASNPLNGSGSQSISCFAIYRRNDSYSNNYNRLIDKSNAGSGGGGWSWVFRHTGGTQFYIDGDQIDGTADRPEDSVNVWYALGVSTWKEGTLFKARNFQDGVFYHGELSQARTMPTTTTSASISNWSSATDRNIHGDLACLYVWSRKVLDEEHKSLYLNPYQFLVPA